MTIAEELKARGIAQGITRGWRESLERLLTLKFGPLSASISARLRSGDDHSLDRWLERALSSPTAAAAVEP